MKALQFLLFLLIINCTGSSNIKLSIDETNIINKAISLAKNEINGVNKYYVCKTFVEINYHKLQCSNTEDLLNRSDNINSKYFNKSSVDLGNLSTCNDCSELYLISGFDDKYLFLEYIPEGYNLGTGCSKKYYYSDLFLFKISDSIPEILCQTGNSKELFY